MQSLSIPAINILGVTQQGSAWANLLEDLSTMGEFRHAICVFHCVSSQISKRSALKQTFSDVSLHPDRQLTNDHAKPGTKRE